MKFPHQINVQWSDEDGVFIARVPALGPAVAAHGDTAEEAVREAIVAATAVIESIAEEEAAKKRSR